MSQSELLLHEINKLPVSDFLFILKEMFKKARKIEKLTVFLDEIEGIGTGIWEKDAQEFINELRNDNR